MPTADVHDDFATTIGRVLTPPPVREPLVLDLFAGCGGLALGFEAQGFETMGFEMVGDYSSTYNRNLKGICVLSVLTPRTDLPKARVIIGGPPCQPFSVIGKQMGLQDSRDGFPAFFAAISRIDPAIWLFENVRGLYYRNRAYLNLIMQSLRGLGYLVEAKLLNASDFGVPQNRERVIVVGHRGNFSFPEPARHKVTAGEALGELAFSIPQDAKFLTPEMDLYVKKYEIASYCTVPRDLHLDRPARTVTCRNLAAATGDMMRVRLPDGRRRRLTVREAARLQSFPDWFEFEGSEESQFYQIGNAVPPLLAYHLARQVREYLNSDIRLSSREIEEHSRMLSLQAHEGQQLELPLTLEDQPPRSNRHRATGGGRARAYYQVQISKEQLMEDAHMKYIDPEKAPRFAAKAPDVQQLIQEALYILDKLGIPFQRLTERRLERMAMAFLAVAQVFKPGEWKEAKDLADNMSTTTRDIIKCENEHFEEHISPGSYDDIRRQDMELPVLAGIILPTKPESSKNAPNRGYALNPDVSGLIRAFGTTSWEQQVAGYVIGADTLAKRLSDARFMPTTEITLPSGVTLPPFGPGPHNRLQKAIVEQFLGMFCEEPEVLYVGDAGDRFILNLTERLAEMGVPEISRDELPDIIAFSKKNSWLYLIEAVHTTGAITSVRREKFRMRLLAQCTCPVIYVTAFLNRKTFKEHVGNIAWETEVWIAESPDHMIHFDGRKFLGPYSAPDNQDN